MINLDAGRLRPCLFAFAIILLPGIGLPEALASAKHIRDLSDAVQICKVPDPESPGSAFDIAKSEPDEHGDYWVTYRCKETCTDWRACTVPSHTADGSTLMGGDGQKQGLAFVVDRMGGHFSFTTQQAGDKTVLIHEGSGGTRFAGGLASQIERASDARVVLVRWDAGYTAAGARVAFPVEWGWFTRTSAGPSDIPELTKRVAAMLAWVHENLAGPSDFGTVGCSMGTQATLGAVYWHDVDDVVDYQLMVGGPGLWDINAGCGRRIHEQGFCDLNAAIPCRGNAECASAGEGSQCVKAAPIPAEWMYESFVNHVHATRACNISQGTGSEPYAPFDESSFAFTDGDWDFDHPIDFQLDLWQEFNPSSGKWGGDHAWALGHTMQIFNSITSESGHEKRWNTTTHSSHCAAFGNGKALDLILSGMNMK